MLNHLWLLCFRPPWPLQLDKELSYMALLPEGILYIYGLSHLPVEYKIFKVDPKTGIFGELGYGVAGNSDRHDGVRGCSDMCMVCMLQHKRYDLYASSYEGYAAYLNGEVYMTGSVHMSGPFYILGPLYKPAGYFIHLVHQTSIFLTPL
jgi:hypothetical protein